MARLLSMRQSWCELRKSKTPYLATAISSKTKWYLVILAKGLQPSLPFFAAGSARGCRQRTRMFFATDCGEIEAVTAAKTDDLCELINT